MSTAARGTIPAWSSRQTSAPGPFASFPRERGIVAVEALGEDRFRVSATGTITETHEIIGYDAALGFARELASRMGAPAPVSR